MISPLQFILCVPCFNLHPLVKDTRPDKKSFMHGIPFTPGHFNSTAIPVTHCDS